MTISTRPAKPPKSLSLEDRERMIADAAYYLAEKRGFNEESRLDNWLAAEREIDATLQEQSLNS